MPTVLYQRGATKVTALVPDEAYSVFIGKQKDPLHPSSHQK